ncbi:MAG TPA: hypothetical protein VLE49_18240 [Anaerolineales bacterium]|nr:hypothetical protein [Anaerolineales bacterium]
MDNSQILDHNVERIGWGLLAILWGATILFDFVPFSVGLIGTGLILLGAHAVRQLNQLPASSDNTVLGILILAWGGLELARPWLRQLFPSADLDWVIFAVLLIGWGLILLTRALLASRLGQTRALAREE